MCGINGFNFPDKKIIKKMNESIYYRGPDQGGYYIDNKVSLGMRRLKIIDLSEKGRQPMPNHDKTLWIVFNGEIYNFQEIKRELEENGHEFFSKSDTEVILNAYEEWGTDCVKKFNGMWAFCIYDRIKNILFLSRDRFGKKPLYYYDKQGDFIFSSEIKAMLRHQIKKELNTRAVSSFLSYRYVLGEETFFKNIKKLLPANNLVYNLKNKTLTIKEYWDLAVKPSISNETQVKKVIDESLQKSIAYRKISDVPLGVILSGGLDSSLITALLAQQEKKPINTFTVKFAEPGFDETKFARIVADACKTNHYEVLVDSLNFLKLMQDYIKYKDEPIGVPNEIALFLLSKKIKEKATVVLSGEGADEIFEGYGRKFSSARDYEILRKLKKLKNADKVYKKNYSELYKKYQGKLFDSELDHFLFEYKYFTEEDKIFLLHESADYKELFKEYDSRLDIPYQQKISYLFIKLHLPGLLNRLDSPTMASSVEGRAPFLDFELVHHAFNLPSSLKTKWLISEKERKSLNEIGDNMSEKKNISKYILKKVAEKYLPQEIVYREKQGFPLPLDNWFKGNFFEISKKLLLARDAKIRHVVNQNNLAQWIQRNKDKDVKRFGQKLWMLVSLELWLREWFEEL